MAIRQKITAFARRSPLLFTITCIGICLLILFWMDSHRFGRAFDATLDSWGGKFTFIAFMIALALAAWDKATVKGATEHVREKFKGRSPVVWAILLAGTFVWHYASLPREKFTPEEIAKKTAGCTVFVDGKSGFWFDKDGRLCTWTKQKTISTNRVPVTCLIETRQGKVLQVQFAAAQTTGQFTTINFETGLAAVRSPSPFARAQMFADATDTKTGKTIDEIQERPFVGTRSKSAPEVGETIVLKVIETTTSDPAIVSLTGKVTRIEYDLTAKEMTLRVHTDIPFKATYAGGPAFDLFGDIKGAVSGDSNDKCVLLPPEYIERLYSKDITNK